VRSEGNEVGHGKTPRYQLAVGETNDNPVCARNQEGELKLVNGRAALPIGKKRPDPVVIARDDGTGVMEGIQMGRVVRKNLRVRLSDLISIHAAEDCHNCDKDTIKACSTTSHRSSSSHISRKSERSARAIRSR
jgi:hypothetical protein